jgi:hypothetical protein
MITPELANTFVRDWIKSFNDHNIVDILSHYEDELVFYSPFILLLNFNKEGIIRTKSDLKRYFEIGLKTYPNLYFKLHNYFIGVNTIVIYYTSVNDRLAAETFQLNENGKVLSVYCHYTNNSK